MEMEININITGFSAEIKPVAREDNIKAFVDWKFITDQGDIKIHGGTIRLKSFGKDAKQLLSYDAPAIRTKGGFNKVLFINNLEFFKRLCEHTINEYCRITDELSNHTVLAVEEIIDPDVVPF